MLLVIAEKCSFLQNQNKINRQLGLSISLLGKNIFACLFLCISLFFRSSIVIHLTLILRVYYIAI